MGPQEPSPQGVMPQEDAHTTPLPQPPLAASSTPESGSLHSSASSVSSITSEASLAVNSSASLGASWETETASSSPPSTPKASQRNSLAALCAPGSPTPKRDSSPTRPESISCFPVATSPTSASAKLKRSNSLSMGYTGDNLKPKAGGGLLSPSSASPPGDSLCVSTAPSVNKSSNVAPVRPTIKTSGGFFKIFKPSSTVTSPYETTAPTLRVKPSQGSLISLRGRPIPDITSPLLIDEFSGICFRALLNSFIPEPEGTPEDPEEVKKQTVQARLEDAVGTAGDLLERVYEAYKTRTAALGDAMNRRELEEEEVDEARTKVAQYKLQLERIAKEESKIRDQQKVRLDAQEKRIKALEEELRREKRKREELEEETRRKLYSPRRKRASAASDSGFESDTESMFSLNSKDNRNSTVLSPVDSLMDGGVDDSNDSPTTAPTPAVRVHEQVRCDTCSRAITGSALSATSTVSRNPTPLRETWSPDSPAVKTSTSGSKWNFSSFRGGKSVWGGPDIETVRQENRILRARVGELEGVVEEVLDVVAGRTKV
ncbi:hypothetical protein RUND412_010068 [Rhizina undulata]